MKVPTVKCGGKWWFVVRIYVKKYLRLYVNISIKWRQNIIDFRGDRYIDNFFTKALESSTERAVHYARQ